MDTEFCKEPVRNMPFVGIGGFAVTVSPEDVEDFNATFFALAQDLDEQPAGYVGQTTPLTPGADLLAEAELRLVAHHDAIHLGAHAASISGMRHCSTEVSMRISR